ncbi:hypothetical protein [Massilia sp. YMA4]|uniref:hypothetical protein n=1 Tax=Massilia sp. YMA4 TaxID=1593482 RepID=UPI00187887E2|nr:hypothetical protein [Massilia sp. YMA4]
MSRTPCVVNMSFELRQLKPPACSTTGHIMAEASIDLCDGRHTKPAKTTFTKINKPQNCPPRIMKDAVAEINSYPLRKGSRQNTAAGILHNSRKT